jgi:quinol monooxygenase YgiN
MVARCATLLAQDGGEAMYIQIVNFNLRNMTPLEFEKLCDGFAPQFVNLPGLLSKVWLADPATNTFGGVYTWQDRAASEAYTRSELFKAVASHPNLANISSRGFDVLEEPTRQTRGFPARTAAA